MSYQREIQTKPAMSQTVASFTGIENVKAWLVAQAKAYQMATPCYLLAHANDGVIWGRLDEGGNLLTSYDALENTQVSGKWDISRVETAQETLPPLRSETLQQARLFNKDAELYVWRDGDGKTWHGRLIANVSEDETAAWSESFDEPQLLWGTHGTHLVNDFTLLEDRAQGFYHAVPVKLALDSNKNGELKKSQQLLVRHYLDYDKQGQIFIASSRLVAVKEETNGS